MTMASSFMPGLKAAQEVKPMKGGICHWSTETLTSVRGAVTLKTPSSVFILPLKPVAAWMALVSSFCPCDHAEVAAIRENRTGRNFDIFIRMMNLSFVEVKYLLHPGIH